VDGVNVVGAVVVVLGAEVLVVEVPGADVLGAEVLGAEVLVVEVLVAAATAGWFDPTSSDRLATAALTATTMIAAASPHRH